MRRVLITGGAGFIGGHLADRLITEDYEIVIIDNESTGLRENVNKKAKYIRGDICNINDLNKAFKKKIDIVFHIAGQASTFKSFENPYDDLRVNVQGTINILNKCLERRVSRLLYASSMTCYGHPQKIPIGETEQCKPISYYGVTKYAAERYVHSTAERSDLDFDFKVTSFRMFNVYGERQSLSNPYQGVAAIFISNLLKKEPVVIHSDGEQSRDFVYIDDVVDAWVISIDNPEAYNQVFNLGSGTRMTINQLVDTVLKAFEKNRRDYKIIYEPMRPGDQRHMKADISLAKKILSWEPKVSFDEGMKKTIHWAVVNKSSYLK